MTQLISTIRFSVMDNNGEPYFITLHGEDEASVINRLRAMTGNATFTVVDKKRGIR